MEHHKHRCQMKKKTGPGSSSAYKLLDQQSNTC